MRGCWQDYSSLFFTWVFVSDYSSQEPCDLHLTNLFFAYGSIFLLDRAILESQFPSDSMYLFWDDLLVTFYIKFNILILLFNPRPLLWGGFTWSSGRSRSLLLLFTGTMLEKRGYRWFINSLCHVFPLGIFFLFGSSTSFSSRFTFY
jgi:hypothetical protein